jgi:hypothetical protein
MKKEIINEINMKNNNNKIFNNNNSDDKINKIIKNII